MHDDVENFLCHTQQMCSQTFLNQQQYSPSVVLQSLCSSRKKIHTHPIEGHWKFPGERGSNFRMGGGRGAKQKNLLWGGGGDKKRNFLELHIILLTSIQSIGRNVGCHPLCVGDHNDINMQKPV